MKKLHIHSWYSGAGNGDKDYFFTSLREVRDFLKKRNEELIAFYKAKITKPVIPTFGGSPEATFDISETLAKKLNVRIASHWGEYDTIYPKLQFFTCQYPIFERGFKSLEEKEAADKKFKEEWDKK